jgi:hypothetical protein
VDSLSLSLETCWDSTWIRPPSLPSRSFSINNSGTILSLGGGPRFKINHEKEIGPTNYWKFDHA